MPPGNELEWSHDRVRPALRVDQVTPVPSQQSEPIHEAGSKRFAKGNQAWRRREAKRKAKGIATLAPSACSTWLRPHVEHGAAYIVALVETLAGKPVLHPLAGDTADAHTVYRALMAEAARTEGSDRIEALKEARAWLREHRAAIATLCALAGDLKPPPAPSRWVVDDDKGAA